MGANSWRMSHNPPNPKLLDFADEYGLLAWDENRNFAKNSKYLSVVIWSLCKEDGSMEGSGNGANVGHMLEEVIHAIDNVDEEVVLDQCLAASTAIEDEMEVYILPRI